ncbi:MarC family NAAT transporter [Chitinilyticum litopenaei]|uniref:MarC family NAAT transporter n=1 Tax=Chitinilyticum litopenaei TaxID=1121276 RepID=UPI0004093C9E|nr:MarC family NAAT transporter [Chitinilyticum litopenaei]
MLLAILTTVFGTLMALLPICNPLITVGVLPGLTAHLSEEERDRQVKRACYFMAGILTTFLLAGALIMDFFSISIPGLRIAGGMIVSFIGFRMLFPQENQSALTNAAEVEVHSKNDISFTPLAMPFLSGPGSIAVVISMSSGLHAQNDMPLLLGYASVVAGIALTAWISWLTLRASTPLYRILGENGINAVVRIMGFFLICIGVQFFINGVSNLLHDPAFMPQRR